MDNGKLVVMRATGSATLKAIVMNELISLRLR